MTRRLHWSGPAGVIVSTLVAAPLLALAGCSQQSAAPAPATGSTTAAETPPSGDIPDTTAYVAYTDPGGRFALRVPEGWARSMTAGAVTFTDKLNSITVGTDAAAAAPTVAATRATVVPALQGAASFSLIGVSVVHRKAGSAVLTEYHASSAPDAVTGKTVLDDLQRYAFYAAASHTEVDVTVSGPTTADNVDPWRTVTDSVVLR